MQQILTLKLIGLSLDEIRQLLTTDSATLQQLLARQKQILTQQMHQLQRIIDTLDAAGRALQASPHPNLEQFIDIIKAVNMSNQTDWFSQFLTDDQQQAVSQNSISQPLDHQRAIGEAWKTLFADVLEHIEDDIHSPEVQQLVARWDALMGQVTQDGEVADSLNAAYAHIDSVPDVDSAPDAVRDWVHTMRDAAAFIQRARTAQSE